VILLPVEFARGGLPNLPQGADLAIHAERKSSKGGKLDGKSVSLKQLSNLHLV
jgi:hypothetical protein